MIYINKIRYKVTLLLALACLVAACSGSKGAAVEAEEEENQEAKEMLQGVWLNADDEEVTLMVKGDTIVYADSTLHPVCFAIVGDSLVMKGYKQTRYKITRQTDNIFEFENVAGDMVKLVRSTDSSDADLFLGPKTISINQGVVIKRDTVVTCNGKRYHAYVQVNPTSYKVVTTSYNAEGIAIDKVSYDNIINLCIYDGQQKLFSHNFRKQDFARVLPRQFAEQGILSDIEVDETSANGIVFVASIGIPDSQLSFQSKVTVTGTGRFSIAK